jgi:DNA recombination protein RmuC
MDILSNSGLAVAVAVAFLVLAIVGVIAILRAGGASRAAGEEAARRSAEMETQIGALLRVQSELTGRLQTMSESISGRQEALTKAVTDNLAGMSHRLQQSMGEATKSTHENLKTLHERLAVIDAAKTHIADLTGQVTTLSNILANKQTRGAFGQGRMEAIISDSLPPGAYAFQFTLKSGSRPDCVVHLPNDAPPLVIDAKFPLEAYSALRAAETPEAIRAAQQQFRGDLLKHVKDIREKYLVPGETHETALMFVPSESVFAEIHESMDEVVQRAYRERIVIVSPTHLMLSVQVIQAVLRDHRLREQAHIIQDEVRAMMLDVERLDDRVRKLAGHFGMAEKDIQQILVSSEKVTKRGRGIESIGLTEREPLPLLADVAAE